MADSTCAVDWAGRGRARAREEDLAELQGGGGGGGGGRGDPVNKYFILEVTKIVFEIS